MPEIKHNKSTDSENEIKLTSSLVYASWRKGSATAGCPAEVEVGTSFVGSGAKIKITGKSVKGKKLGKISSKINGNLFIGKFDIPEDIEPGDKIYFEVDLSKNGLKGKSNSIKVFPKPDVTNMSWSAKKAKSGEIVTLSADVDRVADGAEAKILIYEYDNDSAHDLITELPAKIENKKISVDWEFEYREDTDDILTEDEMKEYGGSYNPPEYFFVVDINGFKTGDNQESELLTFKDYLELKLVDDDDNPIPEVDYKITLPDGTNKEGKLDENGEAKLEDIPPGKIEIKYSDVAPEAEVKEHSDEVEDDDSEIYEGESEEDHDEDDNEQVSTLDEEPEGEDEDENESSDSDSRAEHEYVDSNSNDFKDPRESQREDQTGTRPPSFGSSMGAEDEEELQG